MPDQIHVIDPQVSDLSWSLGARQNRHFSNLWSYCNSVVLLCSGLPLGLLFIRTFSNGPTDCGAFRVALDPAVCFRPEYCSVHTAEVAWLIDCLIILTHIITTLHYDFTKCYNATLVSNIHWQRRQHSWHSIIRWSLLLLGEDPWGLWTDCILLAWATDVCQHRQFRSVPRAFGRIWSTMYVTSRLCLGFLRFIHYFAAFSSVLWYISCHVHLDVELNIYVIRILSDLAYCNVQWIQQEEHLNKHLDWLSRLLEVIWVTMTARNCH